MGLLTRLASGNRAIPKTGLGMSLINPTGPGGIAATVSTRYTTPGQPIYQEWDATGATQKGYLGHTYVMRCVRLRAETVAGLPFRAGPDPDNPSVFVPESRLMQLLGSSSPASPGGPNPTLTARALWIWTLCQRIVTGRQAWQAVRIADSDPDSPIQSLYPLVSAALDAVAPTQLGGPNYFDSFVYHTPLGDMPLKLHQVVYDWRMSAEDPRQAESVIQAAALPIQLAIALDRYMWGLISKGMMATNLVLAPPFAEASAQRAWEDQFQAQFAGADNAGNTIFASVEADEDESTGKALQSVQVIPLTVKGTDAQMLETVTVAKTDINVALGVPESLIGNAAQRIYANADAEERVFWTTTAINDVEEAQDAVNLRLAQQLDEGKYAGWFDLTRVASLQPSTIFQPPAITDAIQAGLVTTQQAADLLGIPAHSVGAEDTTTAPIGEVVAGTNVADSASGGRSIAYLLQRGMRYGNRSDVEAAANGFRAMDELELPDGWGFRYRPTTTHTYRKGNAGWGIVRRSRTRAVAGIRRTPITPPSLAVQTFETVTKLRRQREGYRSEERIAELAAEVAALREGERSFDLDTLANDLLAVVQ